SSAHQIDDWISARGDEVIELVDASAQVKVAPAAPPVAAKEVVEEEEEEKEDDKDDDFDGGYSKTNDPVRMYLRKMGSVSLLTREGEVEIAKRIEEGERRVLQVVLNSSIAVEEILELGNKLRADKCRVKEVIRDVD